MKRFTISCDFGDRKAPFHVYVGEPSQDKHPLHCQSRWLSRERGGLIPTQAMESFEKLHAIAKQHKVSLAQLSGYAFGPQIRALNEDAFTHLRDGLQEFREQDYISPESSKPTTKRNDIATDFKRPVAATSGFMRGATASETACLLFETSKMLWPLSDEQSAIARLLFMCLGLHLSSFPERALTLGEIYLMLTSSDDLSYSLAVVLDTRGRCLPWLAYSLMDQWLNCETWLRERVVFHMTTTLTDFAMCANSSTDSLQPMREDLYQLISSGFQVSS